MYPQIDYSRSGKVALVAFVWIFSTVLFQMFPQIALLRRGLVTVVTFVWLFYSVRFQMLHQIACLRRGIVALVAFVWLFPHMCGKTHLFTDSSCVAFTTQVCFIADMCGNNQICVRKPHRDVLGFFHTCVVKHTHGLISPWNHGGSGAEKVRTFISYTDLYLLMDKLELSPYGRYICPNSIS